MTVDIPELEKVMEILPEIKEKLDSILKENASLKSEWYNDEECWKLKGGGSLASFRSNRFYQPKGGIPDAKVCGRKVWSKKTVEEWLLVTDDELEEYHKKYRTGATKR